MGSLRGSWPIATNRPVTASSRVSPVTVSRSVTPLSLPSPWISATSEFQANRILSLATARSAMILLARSSSRRWMIVTVRANFVRKVASSMAESPPPTTAMSWSRKKNPSQAELAVGRAHREDDRAGAVDGALAVGDGLDLAGQVDGGDVVGDELGAEALGLGAHAVHEVGPHDAVLEAGEVLDLGRVHQRATGGHSALEDEGREVRARGVDGGGVSRRA